ncbi:MAG: hypothetical protein LUH23_09595 [Oscillospiraceae bacterium]|nr:hypothetical protein [Oscillospiraceae bacterium]
MKAKIYATNERKGYGKQNYYSNEYWLEDSTVEKYKCHRQKTFNGDESEWNESKEIVDSWDINDPNMPSWLNKYIHK